MEIQKHPGVGLVNWVEFMRAEAAGYHGNFFRVSLVQLRQIRFILWALRNDTVSHLHYLCLNITAFLRKSIIFPLMHQSHLSQGVEGNHKWNAQPRLELHSHIT